MKPIIEIQNISKKFRIEDEKQAYLSLRDSLGTFFQKNKNKREDFLALKNVNFDVMQGESIGIIGKNGAGKSTLLKILSKITPPTSGKIISRGRIASLLEVGTGFHPELSGRENVFLNGSILGMKRAEIQKNFDAIVDFSGVQKFIDTPLKHYSSGMQLRLAFAVAAFLENEILIIDEVLAVGDAEFQKKCMLKMDEVSKSGRTILFVSHNMGAVKQLCSQVIYLEKGQVKEKGESVKIINNYLNFKIESPSKIFFQDGLNKFIHLESIELLNAVENSFVIEFDQTIEIKIVIKAKEKLQNVSIGLGLTTSDYTPVFTVRNNEKANMNTGDILEVGTKINHNLRAGLYILSIGVANGNFNYYHNSDVSQLEILNYGTKNYIENNTGLINCDSDWMNNKILQE
ncbi:MAG: ABC transporter ATP-binding protein [Bacteroidia bacterium]